MTNAVESSSQLFSPLKRNPSGLSAYDVEHALSLPDGAWKRRRLYALRARSAGFKELGVMPGDYLIVEPGQRIRPFQLVVLKDKGRVSVSRAGTDALNRSVSVAAQQTAPLPFRSAEGDRPARVVGTVVGLLRRGDDGSVRAVKMNRRGSGESGNAETIASVERKLGQWCAWVDSRVEEGVDDSTALARWRGLSLQLATLLKCLKNSRSKRLFDALCSEIRGVLETMASHRTATERSIPTGHPRPGEIHH